MPYYPDIEKRIQQLADALRVNQTELGKMAGVSKAAAGNWFAGKSKPQRDALAALKKATRVNSEWLMDGKGEMFLSRSEIRETAGDYGTFLNDDEKRFLDLHRKMTNQEKDALFVFLSVVLRKT